MEKSVILECDYCGERITEDDYKCPKCGASCSHIVKKYKEQQERDALEAKRQAMEREKEEERKMLPTKMIIVFVSVIIFITALMVFFHIFSLSKQDLERNPAGTAEVDKKDEKMTVGYQEVAENATYSIQLAEYENYEYVSESFPNQYNTPQGYQKIAFKFVFVNKSMNSLTSSHSITLKADGFQVEESNLKIGMFESVVTGKSQYPEFNGSLIAEDETFQGYIGYLVPKDKKELVFTFKDVTIKMDNPSYQE